MHIQLFIYNQTWLSVHLWQIKDIPKVEHNIQTQLPFKWYYNKQDDNYFGYKEVIMYMDKMSLQY